MLTASIGRGIRAIFTHAKTALLLWFANLALSSVAVLPVWLWWSRTSLLPETDPLLERFHAGIFRDLLIDGGGLGILTLALTITGLLVVALPVSVFLAGGTLEALVTDDGHPFIQRFVRGGAHFFWRFLRLTIVAGLVMIITVGITAVVAGMAVGPLSRSDWAPGAYVALAIEITVVGAVMMFFLLALDYARIRLALNDRGGVLRAWLSSLGLVARNPLRTYGLAFVFAVLFGLVAAAYLLAIARLGTHTMGLILATAALQQLFVFIRAALRIGLLASEMELFQWLQPATAHAGRLDIHEPPPLPEAPIDLTLAQ